MVITYHGVEFFKIQFGDTVVAFNPVSKDSKFRTSRFGAGICFISMNNKDMNGSEQVTFGEQKPFVISGPGEYEIKDIFIKGFESRSSYGVSKLAEDRLNTIYLMTLDSMNVCFLGAVNGKELSKETVEGLGDIDILFVPIGGGGVLSPAEAYKLAVSLEPKLIIPMLYEESDIKDPLSLFLKEGGSKVESTDKLSIKRKDLEGKEGEIVVLKAQ